MKKSTKKKQTFGYHLALDLYDCDENAIRDIENNYYFLDTIPKIIKTEIQSPPFIIHKKGIGFAGWIPVVESGISLYASFPNNFVSIDVYTCKKFDTKKTKDFAINLFNPKKVKEYYFLRGEDYAPPVELIKLKEKSRCQQN